MLQALENKEKDAYWARFQVCLTGRFNEDKFRLAWQKLTDRYAVLRTAFTMTDKGPVQVVLRSVQLNYNEHDWRHYDEQVQESMLSSLLEEAGADGFKEGKAPLMRFELIREAEEQYRFIWYYHHIIFDGWSSQIIFKELLTIYLSTGTTSVLGEAPPFRNYIQWLKGEKQSEASVNAYWRQKLSGLENVSRLQVTGTATRISSFQKTQRTLDSTLTNELISFARSERVTMNTLIQGAWSVLMSRYCHTEDVLFGVTNSGRDIPLPGAEDMVGLLINTLPMRVMLQNLDVTTLLKQLQKQQMQDNLYAHTRLSDIPELAGFENGTSLFDTRLDFQNYQTDAGASQLPFDLSFPDAEQNGQSHTMGGEAHSDYALSLLISVREQVGFYLKYDAARFTQDTAADLLSQLETVLTEMTRHPGQKAGDIQIMNEEATRQMMELSMGERHDFERQGTVVDWFEAQVARSGASRAVLCGNEDWSYKELGDRANRMARFLKQNGLQQGDFVPVVSRPSAHMVAAILGILKAGGVYVPVNPDNPENRIHTMLRELEVDWVIAEPNMATLFEGKPYQIVTLEDTADWMSIVSASMVNKPVDTDQQVYMIHTSGSTGTPKGIMVTHANLSHYLNAVRDYGDTGSANGSFLSLSPSFDASITTIFLPLVSGKSLVLSTQSQERVFEDPNFLANRPYDFLKLTPSHVPLLRPILEKYGAESIAANYVFGGEVLKSEYLEVFCNSQVRVINEYGPTETTVGICSYALDMSRYTGPEQFAVPIGRPFYNNNAYVVDNSGRLVPVGVTGELWIGGEQVTQGYHKRPELTASTFIDSPFEQGERVYKTGDLVSRLPSGELQFAGRKDEQLKIRGYRIEPGEIETVLGQHPEVVQAVVIARKGAQDQGQLVAYIVSKSELQQSVLETYLSSHLPGYMIPRLWVAIDSIPLTLHGKLDINALPEVQVEGDSDDHPLSDLESEMTDIWKETLGIEEVGLHDNFFSLGGDSISSLQIVFNARERGITVEPGDVFDLPTVAALCEKLASQTQADEKEETSGTIDTAISEFSEEDQVRIQEQFDDNIEHIYPLTPMQEGILFHAWLAEGRDVYWNQIRMRLTGEVDPVTMQRSWEQLVVNHEILRTAFIVTADGPRQVVCKNSRLDFHHHDWRAYSQKERVQRVKDLIDEIDEQPFTLGKATLMRFDLIRQEDDVYTFLWYHHHILIDGWSVPKLIKELTEIYSSNANNDPFKNRKQKQFSKYVQWLHDQAEKREQLQQYWTEKLSGFSMAPMYRFGLDSAGQRGMQGIDQSIQPEFHEKLKALARKEQITLSSLFQSAWSVLLSAYTGSKDVVFGVTNSGRHVPVEGIEEMVGLFINTLPMRFNLEDITVRQLLNQAWQQQQSDNKYAHAPLSEIKQWAGINDLGPIFESLLVFENLPVDEALKHNSQLPFKADDIGDTGFTNYPLTLTVSLGEGIGMNLSYDAALFSKSQVDSMMRSLVNILDLFEQNIEGAPSCISLLSPVEERKILRDFNEHKADFPLDSTVVDLFEKQVEECGDMPALVFEGNTLTYNELNARSNQVAHFLLETRKLKPEDVVGICVRRSLEMVVATLGVWKAGAAFVPLDHTLPADRLEFMLHDSGSELVIVDEQTTPFFNEHEVPVLNLSEVQEYARTNPNVAIPSESLSYIIYTSGTTGRPKGVMIEHKSLLNMTYAWEEAYNLRHDTVNLLQLARMSFDVYVGDLCRSILMGGKMVITSETSRLDLEALASLLAEHEISIFESTPGLVIPLMHHIKEREASWRHLQYLLVSSDVLLLEDYRWLLNFYGSKGINVVNSFGTTETTVDSSYYVTSASELPAGGNTPIGKPFKNTSYYVTNEALNPLPVGVPGELLIGGIQVARGYLNREDLNRAKFIQSPFVQGERLYKTGDLARWLPDGNIEFLGRKDNQVKIRGYRMELGEIESVLQQFNGLDQAVVTVCESTSAEKFLVGYFTSASELSTDNLEEYLSSLLPEYMVPGTWVQLDTIPLTANGKVDKKSLPEPDITMRRSKVYRAARNRHEAEICHIWKEVLSLEQVGIDDNFFELGGSSISFMKAKYLMEKALDGRVDLVGFMSNPVISKLRTYLSEQPEPFKVLDCLQSEGENAPLVCVPGLGARAYSFVELSNSLGTDFPFYAYNSLVWKTDHFSSDIRENAEIFINELEKSGIRGPLVLAGHSSGGRLAFEMTRLLESKGVEVDHLILFDALLDMGEVDFQIDPQSRSYEDICLQLVRSSYQFAGSPIPLDESQILELVNRGEHLAWMSGHLLPIFGVSYSREEQEQKMESIIRSYWQEDINDYQFLINPPEKKIKAPITVFKVNEGQDQPKGEDIFLQRLESYTEGGVNLKWVEGNHVTLLQRQYTKALAEKISGLSSLVVEE